MFPTGGSNHTFPQKKESLLGTDAAALQDNEILIDGTIVRETTQWGHTLLSDIIFSGSTVLGPSLAHLVDFLVYFGSVEETLLTGSGDSPGNTGGMPSTDTSDFSITSVGFFLEVTGSPSLHDTGKTFTLGDTNNIKKFVLTEDLINSNFLLKVLETKINLFGNVLSTVDLNLEDIVLLLSKILHQVVLGVSNNSDNSAVLLDSVELSLGFLGVFGNFGFVVGEGFLLGVVPVLVESSESSLVQVLSPDSGQSSKSSWCINVTNNTDNLQWWGLDNGDCFNLLFLIEFGLSSVDISEDVGHAGFESTESSEVAWLGGIISGE